MPIVRRSNIFDPISVDVFNTFPGFASETSAFANTRIDRKETLDAHIFKADLAGVNKEEVEKRRVLQISSVRNEEQKEKNDKRHSVERRFRQSENEQVLARRTVRCHSGFTESGRAVQRLEIRFSCNVTYSSSRDVTCSEGTVEKPDGKSLRRKEEVKEPDGKSLRRKEEVKEPDGKSLRRKEEVKEPDGKSLRRKEEVKEPDGKSLRRKEEVKEPDGKSLRRKEEGGS
uniref:Uncharacterized protein n=2 Tax=Musa acuminata subsp. malaccensis TaxID=214687 RepID=A0A804HU37_MUSAM|nr:PREDICTED: paternally-expressed gene 3 protein-like isoform X2 [Musa acuminata subsp. malaccensis]